MKKRLIACVLMAVFYSMPAYAAHLHKEKAYQSRWCAEAGGVTEFALNDKTRVDCLTEEYAVEVDFAPKWAEAIGQALYYSLKTDKKAGVLLIMEDKDDERYLDRLKEVTDKAGITVWTITPSEVEQGD